MQSPKITDNEIETISRSRSISDDIIRQIANNNEWTRNYMIKANLVNNTKTPLPVAMRFLNFLTPRDVQQVSRSKNVAAPVATAARKLLKKRSDRKG
jgi:ABC-type thiamine transport system substrate-binding protein